MRVRVGTTVVSVLAAALAGCRTRPARAPGPAETCVSPKDEAPAQSSSAAPGGEGRPPEAEARDAEEERRAAEVEARATREKEESERRVASLLARAQEEIRAFRFGDARRLLDEALAVPADDVLPRDLGGAGAEIERARRDCSSRQAEFDRLRRLLRRPLIDRARAGADVAFGVALLEDYGFEAEARKYFRDLRMHMDASPREAGLVGLLHVGMLDAFGAAERRDFRAALAVHEELAGLERELPFRPGPVRDLALLEFREAPRERAILARIVALADPAIPPDAWPSGFAAATARRELGEVAGHVRRLAGLVTKEHGDLRARLAILGHAWSLFIDAARVLPPGDPARREAADDVLPQLSKLTAHFEESELYGPTFWAMLLAGRTQAVGGRWEEARRSFDEVLDVQPGRWVPVAKDVVAALRLSTFLWKVEAAFEGGDHGLAARTAELMLSPFVGYPRAIAEDAGSCAALLRAEALVRLAEPARDEALRECARVERFGPGRWPDGAREVAAWIEAGAPAQALPALPVGGDEQRALSVLPTSVVAGSLGVGTATGPLDSRHWVGRRRAAFRLGSTRQAEEAVDRALEWLAREQKPDGTWSGADAKLAGQDADGLTTGLAILAFLGAGHTEKTGKYQEAVARAVAALVSRQRENGCLGRGGLDHAAAGLALGESFAMTRVRRTGDAARRAVDRSVATLAESRSGWPAAPGEAPDVVSTAWLVMQLRSAYLGGLVLDCAKLRPVVDFLDDCTRHDSGLASLRPGGEADGVATAAALAARVWLGWRRDGALVKGAADRLAADPPRWNPAPPDLAYLHFGGMAMLQVGGDRWRSWNASVRDELVRRQREGPPALAGSWDPSGEAAAGFGRVGTTAVATLALEVYYRYLPVLRE